MRTVTVMLRAKHEGRWQRFPAAYGNNGRIRPGYAQIGEKQIRFDSALYQLRFYEGRQAHYQTVEPNSADVADRQRRQEEKKTSVTQVQKAAEAHGVTVTVTVTDDRKTLRSTANAYITEKEGAQLNEAASQARLVSGEFMRVIRKTYVDEICREDFLKFHAALRKRGCSPRTIANKHQRLCSWLRSAGIHGKMLPMRPKYEKTLPTIYDRDTISSLLGQADDYMTLVILMAWKLGLRDQELQYAEFSDINEAEKTFRVQSKPRWEFTVKDQEQREVPIPQDVITALEAWRTSHPQQSLILATSGNQPNRKLLRTLKRLAKQAGLNCGRCEGCLSDNRECEQFTLHRFRRTYLTTLLRNGFDLSTVQAYAGHADIESTMRYLRPQSATSTQERLAAVAW